MTFESNTTTCPKLGNEVIGPRPESDRNASEPSMVFEPPPTRPIPLLLSVLVG
jgi:hypothetical protein